MVKKIAENFNRLSRAHQRHRQTTDGSAISYIANVNASLRPLKKLTSFFCSSFYFIILHVHNKNNKQQKLDHWKSNMSDENAEDDELYEVTIAAAVVIAVTARDHATRRRSVIGWNKFASWIFFNIRINAIISLKQLWNCFGVLFLCRFRCTRDWNHRRRSSGAWRAKPPPPKLFPTFVDVYWKQVIKKV